MRFSASHCHNIYSMSWRLAECNIPQAKAVALADSLLTWQTRKCQHCIFFHTCVFLSWYRLILAHVVHITLDTVFHKPFPFRRWNGTIYLSNSSLSGTHYIKHFFPKHSGGTSIIDVSRKYMNAWRNKCAITQTHLLTWSHSKHRILTLRTFLSAT